MRFRRFENNFISSLRRIAAALLCCGLMASCGTAVEPAPDITESVPIVTAPPVTETEDTASSAVITEPPVTESAEISSEDTAPPDISDGTSGDTSDDSSADGVTDITSQEDTGAELSETFVTSEEIPAVSVTAATTVTTAAPKPVNIVIPEVKKVSSPGKDVLTGKNASVDYSNASEGYISASYSGTSANAKLRVTCGGNKYDNNVPPGGKDIYFPLSMGSGEYQIQMYEQLEGKMYSEVLNETIKVNIKDEVKMFLYPNKFVNFTQDSAAVKKSAEVCAGKDGTIDKLSAIFVCITSEITYDKQLAATVQSGYTPDPDSVLSKKKGICFDYASLFAAMARAQGIPTRLVIGYASPDIYHAWNEVYTKETGWITVELFLKNNGYNLLDSTFYAGSADKEAIAKYISDTKNYTPMYYY